MRNVTEISFRGLASSRILSEARPHKSFFCLLVDSTKAFAIALKHFVDFLSDSVAVCLLRHRGNFSFQWRELIAATTAMTATAEEAAAATEENGK